MVVFGSPNPDLVNNIKTLEFNSVTKYNWGWSKQQDYIKWAMKAVEQREHWDESLEIPYFPNASIGWDDTPRFPAKGESDIVRYNKSPESFAASLELAKKYCDAHPEQPKLITIFSWNEWIEGGYLLPDVKFGFQHLEAVETVMNGSYDPYSK